MSEPSFAALYRRFLGLVAQPLPLAEAAVAREADHPGGFPLDRWLAANNQEQASERLGIYAHMYFARLRESLREDYSACTHVVGDAVFERIVVRYLVTHPSDNPSLRHHGRHFPEFLRRQAAALAVDCGELRSDLADLAALEWARIEVFDAPEAATLGASTLAALEPAAWADLALRLIPAHRVVTSEHAIDALWLAAEHGGVIAGPRPEEQQLLVWRRGFSVFHRVVSGDEARALALLEHPATFAEVCTAFAHGRPIGEAAHRAVVALEQWLADQLLMLGSAAAEGSWVPRKAP
jgi:hypothetical protein